MTVLRLDPRYPLAWRSPQSLQFGGRSPVVVLEAVTPAEERMLGALRKGVPASALATHGRCTPREADVLLERLAPVLARPGAVDEAPITVRASGSQARHLADLAASMGLLGEPPSGGARRGTGAAVATWGIVIGGFAIPPVAYRDWLRRDVPHVGIVLGIDDVHVSGVIMPGRTPCLRCGELHACDADPRWPAVAAQLIRERAAAADDVVLGLLAMTTAIRRLRSASSASDSSAALRFHIDGTTERVPAPAHAECGCLADLASGAAA